MISQDKAIEIAKKHHGEDFEFFSITHGIPNNCRIFNSGDWFPDDVWCVFCASHPKELGLFSSRAMVISKDAGKILYDGSANDEG